MNPIISPGMPADAGGYVPYFYQAGLFQVYATAPDQQRSRPTATPSTLYRSSSERPFDPRLDRTQTVEQVIAHGYFAVPSSDPVTAIISDKQQTSWLGLDDVISQVRNRYEIYHQNLYQIELGKCAAMNALYTSEAYHGPADSKQFYSRHKKMQDLYEQEREERTSLWKDVSRLRLALPESAQSYLAASRKMSVLQDPPADGQ